ncbi:MAG: glycosyltransferase family 4 protein [Chloroflexi bacterium]|nr:glycosyltransferase family 4 protein [Chloroflexota bacterium]
MRLAYIVHQYPPHSLGGTEVYTASLARTLTGSGHEVHVFCPQAAQQAAPTDGVHLWSMPAPPVGAEGPVAQFWHTFRHRGIEAEFARFLDAVRPEVVHFQHVQGVSARLIEMAAGRPRVFTLHDYWAFCLNSQLLRDDARVCMKSRPTDCVNCATARPDLRRLRRLRPLVALPLAYRNAYLRQAILSADLLIAPSEFLRAQYIQHGFPAAKILTIENGLDMSRLHTDQGDLPSPPARPHFGFLGSLAPTKGVHVLIKAFNRLPPDTALTIYGSDRACPEYGAQLRALAQHPHIRFAGPVAFDRVGAALNQMDYLVVPSLWYENSPLVIQEAFGVGVPVVASRLGALAEKVRDNETGRLFEPGDADALARVLTELVQHPELRSTFQARITPPPTMTKHAELLLGLYRRLGQHPVAAPPTDLDTQAE